MTKMEVAWLACRSLCSYTHPALEGLQHNFSSLERLQQHVQKTLQLSFCPICLESRKVHSVNAWLFSCLAPVLCQCARTLLQHACDHVWLQVPLL